MRLHLLPLFALSILAAPLAAHADSLQDSLQGNTAEAERLANDAVDKIMKALNLMIMSVPRYGAPEVLPNGDIIIRRLDPPKDSNKPVETKDDGIDT